ncbi:hypothetical protein AB0Y20_01240 [Heyndrickxia oleronia]|uniref:hypothetical protein n=1 Tax=Heyndrickxia oleronia TaxID=38875 RepID=UPI003F1E97E2
MSYIKQQLGEKHMNSSIEDFLLKEGFKYGTGAKGEGTMYYVVSGNYTVWFALCKDYLSLYAEYNCGGCVGENICYFLEDDFNSFLRAYKNSVEWAKEYL